MDKVDNNTNQEVIDIINKAKGSRSLRKYADDAGVSAAGLSKIIRGEYKPSASMIRKLTCDKAKPQNGVTYHEMMAAAGYDDGSLEEIFSEVVDEKASQIVMNQELLDENVKRKNGFSIAGNGKAHESINERMKLYKEYITYAIGAVIMAIGSNPEIKYSKVEQSASSQEPYDLDITLKNNKIEHWYFDFKKTSGMGHFHRMRLVNDIGRLLFYPPNEKAKFSLVYEDRETYEYAKRYAGKMSYKGELSVILLDRENNRFAGETYLSHYDDVNEEFYIVDKNDMY